jgi:hypothetical protein
LRRALLEAPTIAYADGGTTGAHVRDILARLGIAQAMKDKLRPYPSGGAVEAVARGDADLVVIGISPILDVSGASSSAGYRRNCRATSSSRPASAPRQGKTSRWRTSPFDRAHIAGCGRVVHGTRIRAGISLNVAVRRPPSTATADLLEARRRRNNITWRIPWPNDLSSAGRRFPCAIVHGRLRETDDWCTWQSAGGSKSCDFHNV